MLALANLRRKGEPSQTNRAGLLRWLARDLVWQEVNTLTRQDAECTTTYAALVFLPCTRACGVLSKRSGCCHGERMMGEACRVEEESKSIPQKEAEDHYVGRDGGINCCNVEMQHFCMLTDPIAWSVSSRRNFGDRRRLCARASSAHDVAGAPPGVSASLLLRDTQSTSGVLILVIPRTALSQERSIPHLSDAPRCRYDRRT